MERYGVFGLTDLTAGWMARSISILSLLPVR